MGMNWAFCWEAMRQTKELPSGSNHCMQQPLARLDYVRWLGIGTLLAPGRVEELGPCAPPAAASEALQTQEGKTALT